MGMGMAEPPMSGRPPSGRLPSRGSAQAPSTGDRAWVDDTLHPLPLRVLVDRAMVETRRHFRTLFPPFAIVLALTYGALSLLLTLWTQRLETSEGGGEAALVVGGCLALIFIALFSYLALAALNVAVVEAVAGRPLDLRHAWLYPLRPRVFATLVLFGLCIFAGALLCFFPALWVMIVLGFVFPVMVLEERFGRAALGRSYRLINHNPQGGLIDNPQVKMVLVLLVTWGLSLLASLLLKSPFQIAQALLVMRDTVAEGQGAATAALWLSVLGELFGALGTTAVQIYSFTAITLLFLDCRRRKEGEDLEEALDRLGARRPGERAAAVPPPLPPASLREPPGGVEEGGA